MLMSLSLVRGMKLLPTVHLSTKCPSPKHLRQAVCGSPLGTGLPQVRQFLNPRCLPQGKLSQGTKNKQKEGNPQLQLTTNNSKQNTGKRNTSCQDG